MSAGTIIICVVLAAAVAAIIAKIVKDKKRGKPIACNCGCEGCPSENICHTDTKK